MYKTLLAAVLLIALVPLAGCGKSADGLVQQQINQMNELADAIEGSADQAELDAIGERMKKTTKALGDLDLTDAQKKELAEKHGKELGKATGRLMKASMSKAGGMMQGMAEDMMEGMSEGMPQAPSIPKGFGQPPKMP